MSSTALQRNADSRKLKKNLSETLVNTAALSSTSVSREGTGATNSLSNSPKKTQMVVSFNSSSSTSVSKHDNSYSSTGSKPAPRLRLLSRHRTIGLSATIGHGWAEETLRAKLMQRRKRQLGINRKLSTPDNLGATGQGEDGGCNRKLTLKEIRIQLRKKFVWAIRMVFVLVKLAMHAKKFAIKDHDGAQSIEELNYYSLDILNTFRTEQLVFNKSNFSTSETVCVPPWALHMMSLPPDERSQEDVTHLAAMLRSMNFFRCGFPNENVELLCRQCEYVRYEKQRVIVKEGHPPSLCYLLFSGTAFVNLPRVDQSSGKKYYHTAAVLHKGTVFGEVGLIHKVNRTASIVSRERIECLILGREATNKIFKEEINKEMQTKKQLMKDCGLFSGWSEEDFKSICINSKSFRMPFGEIVCENTVSSDFIYLVTSGCMDVMCKVTSHPPPHLLVNPPNHAYLPPLPTSHPPLLFHIDTSQPPKEVCMKLDTLTKLQYCDLHTLLENKDSPYILVSRGVELIRIPKLNLRTTPPIGCWQSLLRKAMLTPIYPSQEVLSRVVLEHSQWKSYRSMILDGHMQYKKGSPLAMKPQSAKSVERVHSSPPSSAKTRKCVSSSAIDAVKSSLESRKESIAEPQRFSSAKSAERLTAANAKQSTGQQSKTRRLLTRGIRHSASSSALVDAKQSRIHHPAATKAGSQTVRPQSTKSPVCTLRSVRLSKPSTSHTDTSGKISNELEGTCMEDQSQGFEPHLTKSLFSNSILKTVSLYDISEGPADYSNCLSCEGPLYDFNNHRHEGPCLWLWTNNSTSRHTYSMQTGFKTSSRYPTAVTSTHCDERSSLKFPTYSCSLGGPSANSSFMLTLNRPQSST